jgi:hypothetical protein
MASIPDIANKRVKIGIKVRVRVGMRGSPHAHTPYTGPKINIEQIVFA